ncbi:dipeptidyl aminopeptidase/acylaminoacyl peptidase [Fictibacillus halophilus]|uniref:Dipeptidyl aminopeptidase/acylaminoacyl peptidase n=2 Tax=Fictibacillus halophilus TaxID=1610490 RepID=A0ABV2LEK9_9BACL
MGGFIANGIFARQSKILGLANINGSGSFVLSERLFRKKDDLGDLPLAYLEVLREYDPVDRTNFKSPVLMLHGDSDTVIAIEGQQDYYRHLKEVEKRSNVELKIYKNVNHQFTPEMVSDLKAWLGLLPY